MKKALIAGCSFSRDTITELPYVLKRAGYHVTLMCSPRVRRFSSSYIDRWIEADTLATNVLQQLLALLEKNPDEFDWIILGDDHMLRALLDAPIDPALKTRIGPVRNADHLHVLGSKAGTALFGAANGIPVPPFRVCHSLSEIENAARELGFPVMVKIDRSGGGNGVFECHRMEDIRACQLRGDIFQVEKYIPGALISVEPLFINGELKSYAYSEILMANGVSISTRRCYSSCPQIKPLLESMGKTLQLHGFFNLGFIREEKTGAHYLIELDLRPNAWMAQACHAGIDFARALRDENYTPAPHAVTLSLYHRETGYFVKQRDKKGLLKWACNTDGRWRLIPFYDPRFLYEHSVDIFGPDIQRIAQRMQGRARGILRAALNRFIRRTV